MTDEVEMQMATVDAYHRGFAAGLKAAEERRRKADQAAKRLGDRVLVNRTLEDDETPRWEEGVLYSITYTLDRRDADYGVLTSDGVGNISYTGDIR